MTEATTTNSKPLTVDLPFDLGDILQCGIRIPSCGREAQWMCIATCCDKREPACDQCKREYLAFLKDAPPGRCPDCKTGISVTNFEWIKI